MFFRYYYIGKQAFLSFLSLYVVGSQMVFLFCLNPSQERLLVETRLVAPLFIFRVSVQSR